MPDHKGMLFSKAFRIIPGNEYNRFSYELRKKAGGYFLIYEVALPVDHAWDYLRDKVYPNLVKYLKQKGMEPCSGEGFIVALFFQDLVYLIKGTDFFDVFREMEGLNSAAFHFRVLRWLSD